MVSKTFFKKIMDYGGKIAPIDALGAVLSGGDSPMSNMLGSSWIKQMCHLDLN